ncbi:MAG: mechanosensitive ion channel family protein [Deltaproteobacteria bacterium]|nr:MAG: mechanosensitive ion channel family protein [Deltaproteobacteria bacterium]
MDAIVDWVQRALANPWPRAAVVVAVAIVAAALARTVLARTLGVLVARTATTLDDVVVGALREPLFMTVLCLGLARAADVAPLDDGVRSVTHSLLQTVAVWVWARAAFRIGHAVLDSMSRTARDGSVVQPRTLPVFDMLVKIGVGGLAVYFMFLAWDIDVTAWLASAGIVGIAVGFAAKDTLANLFSGIFIVADAPYKLGDFIVLDGGLRGKVTRIGLRSTRILTRDDVEITIPNAVIGASKIVNETGGPSVKQRIAITVEVAYGSDVDRVRDVLLACADHPEIAADPEPRVRFREFGASGLVHQLLVWIEDPEARGRVTDALNVRVYKALGAAGIEIPYSKHDVYIKEMPR